VKKVIKFLRGLSERKDLTVLVYVAFTNALVAVASYVTANPDIYHPAIVGMANVLLVSVLKRK